MLELEVSEHKKQLAHQVGLHAGRAIDPLIHGAWPAIWSGRGADRSAAFNLLDRRAFESRLHPGRQGHRDLLDLCVNVQPSVVTHGSIGTTRLWDVFAEPVFYSSQDVFPDFEFVRLTMGLEIRDEVIPIATRDQPPGVGISESPAAWRAFTFVVQLHASYISETLSTL